MNNKELQRFVMHLREHPGLLEELKNLGHDAEAVLHWTKERSFILTREQVAEFLTRERELADDDLEQVAGGDTAWTGGTPPPGGG
ncbi:MAG TPA: Nif11-like leader peptide family RiPP precursor [Thermoanaerobaculia bacterium]